MAGPQAAVPVQRLDLAGLPVHPDIFDNLA